MNHKYIYKGTYCCLNNDSLRYYEESVNIGFNYREIIINTHSQSKPIQSAGRYIEVPIAKWYNIVQL